MSATTTLLAAPVRALFGATEGARFEVIREMTLLETDEDEGVGAIDVWVIDETLASLERAGPKRLRGIATCALRLSHAALSSRWLFENVLESFVRHGIPPRLVSFELSEEEVLRDLAAAELFALRLSSIGARVAVSGFGALHASLGCLRRLRAETVKLDASLARGCVHDRMDRAIIQSVVRIGKQIGAATIADGVADEATARLLGSLGVDHVQGPLAGRPVPLDVALAALAGASPMPVLSTSLGGV